MKLKFKHDWVENDNTSTCRTVLDLVVCQEVSRLAEEVAPEKWKLEAD